MLKFEIPANNNNYTPEDPLTPDNRALLKAFLLQEALIEVPETTRSAVELLLRCAGVPLEDIARLQLTTTRSKGPERKSVWSLVLGPSESPKDDV